MPVLAVIPVVGLTAYTAYTDLKRMEIDYWPIVTIFLYGLIFRLIYGGIVEALIFTAVIFIALYVLYLLSKGRFGGGDVRLLTALSTFFSIHSLNLIFLSCIIAMIYTIIQGIITRQNPFKIQSPFAPAVFLATVLLSWAVV